MTHSRHGDGGRGFRDHKTNIQISVGLSAVAEILMRIKYLISNLLSLAMKDKMFKLCIASMNESK